MLEHGVVFCLVVVQLVGTWLCWNMIMSEHDYVVVSWDMVMLEHGVVFCLVVVQLGGTWLCWNTV